MLIPIGFFGAGAAAGAYELIESNILGSNASSVTFSSIPSTYKHLQVRVVAQEAGSGGGNGLLTMRFNGDTGSNYSLHQIEGRGSSVVSGAGTSTTYMYALWTRESVAYPDQFGAAVIDILDYASTAKYKTMRDLHGVADSRVWLSSGNWRSTSVITSITFNPLFESNIKAGSRFSLYGIKG